MGSRRLVGSPTTRKGPRNGTTRENLGETVQVPTAQSLCEGNGLNCHNEREKRKKKAIPHHDAPNACIPGERKWSRGNFEAVFKSIKKTAEGESAPVYRLRAQIFDFGIGSGKDEDLALYWCMRAVQENHDHGAANNSGCICRSRKEYSRALCWFHRAVRLGNFDTYREFVRVHLFRLHDFLKTEKYALLVLGSPGVLVWGARSRGAVAPEGPAGMNQIPAWASAH